MVLSGWRIYNASPIFAFSFPKQITWGAGWAAPCVALRGDVAGILQRRDVPASQHRDRTVQSEILSDPVAGLGQRFHRRS